MSDTIRLTDLTVWTRIGVPDDERAKEQRLEVTIELRLNLKPAGTSDDVAKSIDYQAVRDCVLALAKTERKTVERFAEDCAQAVLDQCKPKSILVTVRKFPFPQAKSVEITIKRP